MRSALNYLYVLDTMVSYLLTLQNWVPLNLDEHTIIGRCNSLLFLILESLYWCIHAINAGKFSSSFFSWHI